MGADVWIAEPFLINHPEKLFLGGNIYIGPHAAFNTYGGIRIGDGCAFGPFVHIYSANHNYENADKVPFDEKFVCKPVDIGPYVWIGGDVIILPGVTIGEGAVIGAGSVVIKDIPAGVIAGGFPAKALKFRNMERFRTLKHGVSVFRYVEEGKRPARSLGDAPKQWYLEAGLPFPPVAP